MTEYEIPYYRPPRPNTDRLLKAAHAIGKSNMLSNGPLCRELEDTVRDFYDVTYAQSCGNCTVGLALALQALRKLTGAQTVHLPAFTWASTEWASIAAQLNRSFVDINPQTWNLRPCGDPKEITMPVSTFGSMIACKEYKGSVLVDGAHAMGTPIPFDNCSGMVISFAPSKLITAGEGGVLLTNNAALASKFDLLRSKFSRMSELNASMALAHWNGLDAYLRDRKNRWMRYREALKSVGGIPQVAFVTNYSTAAFLVPNPKSLQEELAKLGVETRRYYEPLIGGLKNTDEVASRIICLPNWYGCPDTVFKALEDALKIVGKH